jgi:hypothetical protein
VHLGDEKTFREKMPVRLQHIALSVPLVLAIVFTIMYAAGLDLHRITLGALIIALRVRYPGY